MTDGQLRDILNQELARFTGQLTRHLDTRIDELRKDLKGDTDQIQQSLDDIAKQLDTDDAERTAMNHQLDRHEGWHHQTADKLDY